MIKSLSILLFFLCCKTTAGGQDIDEGDTAVKSLREVVVSFNKWEQKLNEVPNRILKLDLRDIRLRNPQTSADLLAQTGAIFVQKSQLGGGSPMIRGFATNRVLIVIDGVRMNNAIFRSGNLQNIISIDALSTESAEVIFGPGSMIYGSDAIGGVMDFHSLTPAYSTDDKTKSKGNALVRYSTANQEKTIHADFQIASRKWSVLSAVSFSDFNDLTMGRNGGQDNYLRVEYVKRINGKDSILKNDNPRLQRFSGYHQWNLLQKIRYRPNEHTDLQYSFTYAGTSDAPRYDRLIQSRQGKLRYAEWNYGPMIWRMHHLQVVHNKKNPFYDRSRLIIAYQDYDESRTDRTRNSTRRNLQSEKVRGLNMNWDAQKQFKKGELFYGMEQVLNKVHSTGSSENILTGIKQPLAGRYPDGSRWTSSGIYGSYKVNPGTRTTFSTGLRYTYGTLYAVFDTLYQAYPFREVDVRAGGVTGSAGMVFRPTDNWQLNLNASTGFRFPNVDDVGKTFESTPGSLMVPNPALRSEYAWNVEAGVVREMTNRFKFEATVFFTKLNHAIVRRPFELNGSDSIDFQGDRLAVEALQNTAFAKVWGVQAAVEARIFKKFMLQSQANLIKGSETDDYTNGQVPLRHAPPFYGQTNVRYRSKRIWIELSVIYNAIVRHKDLPPSEKAKPDIYAKDIDGNPFSPSWHSLNLRSSYQLSAGLSITASWENFTDQRYRPFSSGIVSSGSNLIFAVKKTF